MNNKRYYWELIKNNLGWSVALLLVLMNATTLVSARSTINNLIRACVNNSSGNIRILGENDICRRNESLLEWNSTDSDGVSGIETVTQSTAFKPLTEAEGFSTETTVLCPAGKKATGGGASVSLLINGEIFPATSDQLPAASSFAIAMSAPVDTGSEGPTGWTAAIYTPNNTNPLADFLPDAQFNVTVYAVCVNATP